MATRYWVGNAGTWNNSATTHWSATSGGASGASAPTITDDVIFDANSFSLGSQTVSCTLAGAKCKTLNTSTVTNTPTFTGTVYFDGDVTLGGITATALNILTDTSGSAADVGTTYNLTTNGTVLGSYKLLISINSPNYNRTITANILDDVTIGDLDYSFNGTLNTNDCAIVCTGSFFTNVTSLSPRSLTAVLGVSSITVGNSFSAGDGATVVFDGDSASIFLEDVTAGSASFDMSNASGLIGYVELLAGVVNLTRGASSTVEIAQVVVDPGVTVRFGDSASVETFTCTEFIAEGTVGNHIVIDCYAGSSQIGEIYADSYSVEYADIDHMTALGDIPVVDFNGVNNGNNTNWIFPPTLTSLTPNSGSRSGGTSVTATGTNFVEGGTTITVDVTVLPESEVSVDGAQTTATFTTPAHAVGPISVYATNAAGNSNTQTYTYVADVGDLPVYNPSLISVVARVNQNMPFPQYVMGGRNAGTFKLFKKSTTHGFSIFRSQVFRLNNEFDVAEIRFPVTPKLAANMNIIPVLRFDNEADYSVGSEINSTTFPTTGPGGGKLITLTPKEFGDKVHGYSDFFLELQVTGTALSVINVPIQIEVDVYEK